MTLYGTSPHRKVVSETAPLEVAGPVPVKTTTDPELLVGQTVVDVAGSPALTTSVERKVYDRKGKLLYDDHWSSHYRGDYRLVRVGSKQAAAAAEEEAAHDDDRRDDHDPHHDQGHDDDRGDDDDAGDYDSALAIASTIHCGSRVGRSVCASTHACVVQPSAMRASSPTRAST